MGKRQPLSNGLSLPEVLCKVCPPDSFSSLHLVSDTLSETADQQTITKLALRHHLPSPEQMVCTLKWGILGTSPPPNILFHILCVMSKALINCVWHISAQLIFAMIIPQGLSVSLWTLCLNFILPLSGFWTNCPQGGLRPRLRWGENKPHTCRQPSSLPTLSP